MMSFNDFYDFPRYEISLLYVDYKTAYPCLRIMRYMHTVYFPILLKREG